MLAIFLFGFYFILFCCIIYQPATPQNLTDFSEEIREVINLPSEQRAEVIIPPTNNYLQKVQEINRGDIAPTPAFSGLITQVLGDSPTIRNLRDYVREYNLQEVLRERLGKSVSKATKAELMAALGI